MPRSRKIRFPDLHLPEKTSPGQGKAYINRLNMPGRTMELRRSDILKRQKYEKQLPKIPEGHLYKQLRMSKSPISKALTGQRRRQRLSKGMSPQLRSALAKKGIVVHEDGSISLPGTLAVDAETGRLRPVRKTRRR